MNISTESKAVVDHNKHNLYETLTQTVCNRQKKVLHYYMDFITSIWQIRQQWTAVCQQQIRCNVWWTFVQC